MTQSLRISNNSKKNLGKMLVKMIWQRWKKMQVNMVNSAVDYQKT